MLNAFCRRVLRLSVYPLLACCFIPWSASIAQSGGDVLYPELRSILLVLEEVDQEVRAELLGKGFGNLDSLDMARQRAVDETNTKILDKLIRDYGWPTVK